MCETNTLSRKTSLRETILRVLLLLIFQQLLQRLEIFLGYI